MNVEHVNAPNGNAYGLQKAQTQDSSPPQPAAVEPLNTETPDGNGDQTKGVIRLLQDGHFKGVAEVRLSINFFDELTAIETGQLKAAAGGQINGIIEALAGPDNLLQALGQPDADQAEALAALHDAFAQAVKNANDEFMTAQTPSTDGLIGSLNNAFDAFVEGLWNLFEPEPEPADPPPPAGGGEPPEPPTTTASHETLQTYIDDLQTAFDAAVAQFQDAFAGVQVIPEFSPPNGNGVAYEKFLAIYNEMRGLEPPTQPPDPAEPIFM
ncbi:MAG: hypothetical protein ACYTE5_02940 [Planctomycetota bacterium]|jgi:hypothetical protein